MQSLPAPLRSTGARPAQRGNGFSFLCKGTLSDTFFPLGFHPEYFLSRFLILFTHIGTPGIQTGWVTGEISPAGNSALPYHSMQSSKDKGTDHQKPLVHQASQAWLSGEVPRSPPGCGALRMKQGHGVLTPYTFGATPTPTCILWGPCSSANIQVLLLYISAGRCGWGVCRAEWHGQVGGGLSPGSSSPCQWGSHVHPRVPACCQHGQALPGVRPSQAAELSSGNGRCFPA